MVTVYLDGSRYGMVHRSELKNVEAYFEDKYGPIAQVFEAGNKIYYSLWQGD